MTDGAKPKRPWYVNCLLAFGGFVVLIIVVAALGSGGGNPSSTNNGGTGTVKEQPKEDAIVITASELNAAYKKNEVSADTAYKGKLIDITGTIDSIGKDVFDNPYVALKTGEPYITVQCMLSAEAISQAGELTPGTKITLQGRGNGYLIYAMMKDCTIAPK